MIYFILSQVGCVPIKRSCEQSEILIDMFGDPFFFIPSQIVMNEHSSSSTLHFQANKNLDQFQF